MRWFKRSMPKGGDIRTRRRFLWLPLTIDGETRWLERAVWEEIARYGRGFGLWWKPYQFIDPEVK